MPDIALQPIIEMLSKGEYKQVLLAADKLLNNKKKKAKDKINDLESIYILQADALRLLQRPAEGAAAYRSAAEQGGAMAGICWFRAGGEYDKNNNPELAIACYQYSLEIDGSQSNEAARAGLCTVMNKASQPAFALPYAEWLLENGTKFDSFIAAGYVFRACTQMQKADQSFRKAIAVDPENTKVLPVAIQNAQFTFAWDDIDEYTQKLLERVYTPEHYKESTELNLVHVSWCMDEAINILQAKANAERTFGALPGPAYDHSRHYADSQSLAQVNLSPENKRLRIGYVSADLRNHAILYLVCGVFREHDKEHYEIFAYDHSLDDGSIPRKSFLASVEHHVDTTGMTDKEVADRIYADGIDILVDLMGMTEKNRFGIFAARPAPIQVSYLGFPGSTGAQCIDYCISDPIVTPDSSKPFFTEKLCRLPEAYQCNDNQRLSAATSPSRADYGLPEDGFVFCCFNQSFKIDRDTFDTWMRILLGVPGSVLWLLEAGTDMEAKLREQAQQRGVAPERIIFTPREAVLLHMRRLTLADLGLDTKIYNGHTTTSDLIYAGVPVVTAKGTHFPSRVAASLLTAVGLEDCISDSMLGMEKLAIELAHDKERMQAIRERLSRNRFLYPLFDTVRFTRQLEIGYSLMQERAQMGLPPEHIDVPALPKRQEPFATEFPTLTLGEDVTWGNKKTKTEPYKYQTRLLVCPLCQTVMAGTITNVPYALPETADEKLKENAPANLTWHQCTKCRHIHKASLWVPDALPLLKELRGAQEVPEGQSPSRFFDLLPQRRAEIQQALRYVYPKGFLQNLSGVTGASLLDIYPQSGDWLASGLEYGLNITTLADSKKTVEALKQVNATVVEANFLSININGVPEVIFLHDLLERTPFPALYLRRAAALLGPEGRLVLSFDNAASPVWRQEGLNPGLPLWSQPERMHIYTLNILGGLLLQNGFSIAEALPATGGICETILICRKA